MTGYPLVVTASILYSTYHLPVFGNGFVALTADVALAVDDKLPLLRVLVESLSRGLKVG